MSRYTEKEIEEFRSKFILSVIFILFLIAFLWAMFGWKGLVEIFT